MIINTGMRTDIPAYYSEWFYNRIRDGFVMTRNPYYPTQVRKLRLSPDVVDCLCFCTKNPKPMLPRLAELDGYRQFWFVTITPYGREIEPNVPDVDDVIDSVIELSEGLGVQCVDWRYDPIFFTEKYDMDYHVEMFEHIASRLSGYVGNAIISFIEIYKKTLRNFPGVQAVGRHESVEIIKRLVPIASRYKIKIRTCCEGDYLAEYGADVSGCMTKEVLERAAGVGLKVPKSVKSARAACDCLLGNDIGLYNSCPHKCIYCYANYSWDAVDRNVRKHDPKSPLLIGGLGPNDKVKEAKQASYIEEQLSFI